LSTVRYGLDSTIDVGAECGDASPAAFGQDRFRWEMKRVLKAARKSNCRGLEMIEQEWAGGTSAAVVSGNEKNRTVEDLIREDQHFLCAAYVAWNNAMGVLVVDLEDGRNIVQVPSVPFFPYVIL